MTNGHPSRAEIELVDGVVRVRAIHKRPCSNTAATKDRPANLFIEFMPDGAVALDPGMKLRDHLQDQEARARFQTLIEAWRQNNGDWQRLLEAELARATPPESLLSLLFENGDQG